MHKKMHRIRCIILLLYTLGIHAQPPLTVTYSPQNICALTGSSVLLTCSYTLPQNYYFGAGYWYKTDGQKHVTLVKASETRVKYDYNSPECSVMINNLIPSDSGVYEYRIMAPSFTYLQGKYGVTLSVTDLHVLLTAGTVTEGGNVTLTCDTNCKQKADITFIWYKNTQPTRHRAINNTLHLNPVSSEDAGSYSCAFRGHEQHRSPDTALDVRYAPRNTAVLVDHHGEIVLGESVNLTCRSDANPPVHTYTWYRKMGTQISLLGGGQSYVVANISYETSGLYYCVAQNSVGEQHSAAVSVPIAGQGWAKYVAIRILIVVALLLLPYLLCLRCKSSAPQKTGSTTISQQEADSSPVYNNIVTSDPL
ncbi:HEPACAM family member 2-like isoform X1 [Alosa sapidissima]|uniref:HEPACAM family member 2-like isoform X1 n=1 Tax=Alosa sapidissima TaxID=34773 RepID=UPI001C08F9FD|nr:HEPACAM family member 2-like isoform X1 [Alosa sapidissima]